MELFHFDVETVGAYPDFKTFQLSDKRGSDLFQKKFDKMFSDKYDNIDDAYINNAGIIPTYGKIICISCGYFDSNGEKRITSIHGDDEMVIINEFNEMLKKIEKKQFNLSGFRIVNFDIPWVLHKLHKYRIKPCNIISTYNKKPWEMRITDLSEDWKGKFAWAYSFDEMSYELGIKSPKESMCGSDVHEYYWSGRKEEIKKYCEMDVESSMDISKVIYDGIY